MPPRQYLFFDLGWTLEDETASQLDRAEQAARLVAELGVKTTAADILRLQEEAARRMDREVFPSALAALGLRREQVEMVMKRAVWSKEHLTLYPDTIPLLERLRDRHFLGLIANQSPGTEARLHRYGIRHYFDLVLASAELGLSKPDPRIFQMAQEQAGCACCDAWMVGDRIDNDIRPAKQAGWHTIWIPQGYNALQQPWDEEDVPEYTVGRLSEIADIIA